MSTFMHKYVYKMATTFTVTFTHDDSNVDKYMHAAAVALILYASTPTLVQQPLQW